MKKAKEPLQRHYQQAFEYWIDLVPGRPAYVVLCNFDEFWIYDLNQQLDEPVDRVALDDLPKRWETLGFLLPTPVEPVFRNDLVAVTREAATLVRVTNSLIERGIDRERAQRFAMQCLVAMVAGRTRGSTGSESPPTSRSKATPASKLPIDAGRPDDYDPWSGWEDPQLPAHPMVDEDGLAKALRAVLRHGLPLTTRTAGDALPALRSVIARSIHPYDAASRVDALNRLLVRFIVELDDEDSGRALAVLFAVAKGTRRTTLQSRRVKAAEILSYELTHFRKQIEPKLIRELARALYTDLLRYKRRIRRAPMAEEPTGDTPSITEHDFTHQEELVSRIWQHVYGLRAEQIAVGRLEADPAYTSQVEDHRRAAERERSAVDALVREYVESYGEEFVRHGEAEWSVAVLRRLVGGPTQG